MDTPERATGSERMSDPSIVRFRAVIEAGLVALEDRCDEVNELNVFPVADGDTGDNMVLTLRAVLQELDRLASASEGRTIDEIGRDEIVASVARAALLGARGNSGVILSQLVRGAAEELASRPGELIDPALIGAALARAVDQAYGSVREPAEGTMLTVVREMAGRVASELAHRPEGRLRPDTTALEQDLTIAEVIQSALEAGEGSVQRSPDRLRALREAGVVDAGGYGLVVLVAGFVGALRGTEGPRRAHRWSARAGHPHHRSSTAATLKVPVHTDDPDAGTPRLADAGAVAHVHVADMDAQVAAREQRLVAAAPAPRSGMVAIADGEGLRELYEGFGARVLSAGATVYELLAAIDAVAAEEVVVLPNAAAALPAADRAAELSQTTAVVVASASPQAGLAAAAAHVASHRAAENAAAMTAAVARVSTGSVGPADSDDPDGRYRAGDAVGLVDGEPVAWGDPADALREVLARLGAGAEVVSCLSGAATPLPDAAVRALAADGAPVTQSVGGQPAPWWLLSAQ